MTAGLASRQGDDLCGAASNMGGIGARAVPHAGEQNFHVRAKFDELLSASDPAAADTVSEYRNFGRPIDAVDRIRLFVLAKHSHPSSLEASEPSIRSSGRPATKHKIGRSKETYVKLRNSPELATANRATGWDARSRGMGL